LIGGIWTSALAAHLLGKELTGSHAAGAVAGIVFSTSPYLYAEGAAGCIELVAAGLLPLHAWSLIRLVRKPSWTRTAAAAGILACIGPFNWYYTLFAGLFGLAFCMWTIASSWRHLRKPNRAIHRRAIGMLLLSMALAALIDLPLIGAAQQETPTRPSFSAELFSDENAWDRSQQIADGRAPLEDLTIARLEELDAMQVHLNSTSLLGLVEARFSVNPLGVTPGTLAYSLGLLGLLVGGRRTWGWAVIATGFTVLTLGPYLNPEGSLSLFPGRTHWPLPYAWLYQDIPFFAKAYRPYRFAVIVLQCLAVMAAIGASVLFRHIGARMAAGGIAALAILGFSQPHWAGDVPAERTLMSTVEPDLYTQLAEAPEGAVIELPLHYQPVTLATARQQSSQLTHGHPVINTNQLIRRPDLMAFKNYVSKNSMLRTAVDLGRAEPPLTVSDDDIAFLRDQGFRYLVLHDRFQGDAQHLAGERVWADMVSEPARTMLKALLGTPIIQTEDGQVFDLNEALLEPGRTRTWTGTDTTTIHPPFDTAVTGFTLQLGAGDTVEIAHGPARRFGLWSRPAIENAGAIEIHILGEAGTQVEPVVLVEDTWTYTSVEVEAGGPVGISLVAGDAGAAIALTRMQVMR